MNLSLNIFARLRHAYRRVKAANRTLKEGDAAAGCPDSN